MVVNLEKMEKECDRDSCKGCEHFMEAIGYCKVKNCFIRITNGGSRI